jgi:UDP-N-acetylglucosamine/UDP-N-acetylgalactosamine 4-epimerase
MRVLLTGASGFIGSNLFQRCLDEGWDAFGVDDLSNGHREFLPRKRGVWRKDFADSWILDLIKIQNFDVVFHLAAVPRVSYSVEHPLETNDTNVTKTLKLMEACRGNVKRLVFASSSSVYGGAEVLPTLETAPKDPKSPYALQKSIIEDYLKMYRELYGLDSACMRFFNVIGPNALGHSPYSTALAAWLTAIKSGEKMRSDGDGTQSRDLCPVANVAEALVLAAKHPVPLSADRFNVACGTRTTNKEILEYLLKRYPGSSYRDAPWRAGDVMHTQADVSKLEKILGYKQVESAWECIEKTCTWYDVNWSWVKDLKQGV